MDERGIDLLLLVALQVRVERTSFLPKFLITSSFRATPFLTVTVLLLTSLSSLYQDTVGVGLPATMEKEKKKKRSRFHAQLFPNCFFLSLDSVFSDRGYFYLGSLFWKDPLIAMIFFFFPPPPVFFCPLLFPVEWKRTDCSFVRFIIVLLTPSLQLWWVFTKRNRDCIARGSFINEGN